MKNVLLISGLGPSKLDSSDLYGTRFDKNFDKEKVNRYYTINGKVFDPLNAHYMIEDKKHYLFRKNYDKPKSLVSETLKNILKKNDIDFDFLNIQDVWYEKDFDNKKTYSIVCLSTTFMWSISMFEHALEWLDKNVNYKHLVVGGKYSSLKYKELLEKYKQINYIIIGDGEKALPDLINQLLDHKPIALNNLAYVDNNQLIVYPPRYEELSSLESIKPENGDKVVVYESVRGCVFNCKFCAWSIGNEKFRYKDASKIYEEWKEYVDVYNVEEIQVIDSTFLFPPKRAKEIIENIQDLNVRWKANSRVDIPTDEHFVDALKKSGCVSLKFGFESMSDVVLKYIDKRTTSLQNRKINEVFKNTEIDTIVSFIVGFPGETEHLYNETRKYLTSEHYGHFHLYVFEFEDECMPIWKEKERFKLEVSADISSNKWQHSGTNWSHIGMDSSEAHILKKETLKNVRLSDNLAVHRTWQGAFASPLMPEKSRNENLKVEKLLDRLIYLPMDLSIADDKYQAELEGLIYKLKEHNILFD